MRDDLCCICGERTMWHRKDDGRSITCSELRLRLTGKRPRFTSCAEAMRLYYRYEGRNERTKVRGTE